MSGKVQGSLYEAMKREHLCHFTNCSFKNLSTTKIGLPLICAVTVSVNRLFRKCDNKYFNCDCTQYLKLYKGNYFVELILLTFSNLSREYNHNNNEKRSLMKLSWLFMILINLQSFKE